MKGFFFMEKAIEVALENVISNQGGPFGAIVVKDGKIIDIGKNVVTASNDPTAHAEVQAIRAACQYLNDFQLFDCEIYTSCEPCPMCIGAIYWARPKAVYYACTKEDAAKIGFDDQFIYDEIEKPLSARSIPMIPFMREEALAGFRKWEEKPDKTEY